MSMINDWICPRKEWCDRYARHGNLLYAGIIAIIIDIIIPLVALGIGFVLDFIDLVLTPIAVIGTIVTDIAAVVFYGAIIVVLLVCLILLFREIGVHTLITAVPVVIGFFIWGGILLASLVGVILVVAGFLLNWNLLVGIGAIIGVTLILLVLPLTALVLVGFLVPWALIAVGVRYVWDRVRNRNPK